MQKNFFEILVLTALTVGLIWTIFELTPKLGKADNDESNSKWTLVIQDSPK